jgi:GNAT superfamily N-acetyltransferase
MVETMKAKSSGSIRLAKDADEIRRCFPVMQQLRTHLSEELYGEMVRRMTEREGYRLAYVEDAGEITAVAGFRFMELLFVGGTVLYVDDLITDKVQRSRGYGRVLMEWLSQHARENGCMELHLDSGVQRFDAHRFYFAERMHISSYHFRLKL